MGQKTNPLGFRLGTTQSQVIILFGLHNKKMTLKVYKKMKKYETVCQNSKKNMIQKKIEELRANKNVQRYKKN